MFSSISAITKEELCQRCYYRPSAALLAEYEPTTSASACPPRHWEAAGGPEHRGTIWEWKDRQFRRRYKPYRLLYQQSYEIIRLVHGKERAREWKQRLKGTFLRSHWLLPYPQGNRFMKRHGSRDQQQVCWWSSYHPGVHRYYEAQGRELGLEPLPASDVAHYPLTAWRMSQSASYPTQLG